MVREEVERRVCDVCGGTDDVEPVTIHWRNRSFIVDLCANETGTLEALEKAGSDSPRRNAAPRARPVTHKVVPID